MEKILKLLPKILVVIAVLAMFAWLGLKQFKTIKDSEAGLQQLDNLKAAEISEIELFEYSSRHADSQFPTHLLAKISDSQQLGAFKAALMKSYSLKWQHDTSKRAFKFKVVSNRGVIELNGVVTWFYPHDIRIELAGNHGILAPNLYDWIQSNTKIMRLK